MKPPWWFCCGWWSPWCVLDYVVYEWFNMDMEKEHWFDRRHSDANERYLRRVQPHLFDAVEEN